MIDSESGESAGDPQGITVGGGAGDDDGVGFYLTDFMFASDYAGWTSCDGYLAGLFESFGWCEPDVVVTGPSWEEVDLGNGNSLRFFSNGATGFYNNGNYLTDVLITGMTATQGSENFGINYLPGGGGFEYGANDSMTYTFDYIGPVQ